MSDERARSEEGGLVALAFFFRKRHHLDAEGQALASAVQLAHAGQGHENAQAPVVLAAVAHRVVVAAGHQVACPWRSRVVAAHHVAHGVYLHPVKATFAHALCNVTAAGAVRVGEVGHRELALFGKAGVRVAGQRLVPVPHIVAQHRLGSELVVQANLGNAVDVAQGLSQLKFGVVVQPPCKGVDDFLLGETRAARPAHRQDEREAKAFVVRRVELLNALELLGRAFGEACLALLVGGFSREAFRHHGLARQFGVGANQGQLRVQLGRAYHLRQRVLQVRQAAKGPLRQGLLGNPGRVFVQPVQQRQRFGGAGGVELFQSQWHGGCFKKVSGWRLLNGRWSPIWFIKPGRGGAVPNGGQCRCAGPPTPGRAGQCGPENVAAP